MKLMNHVVPQELRTQFLRTVTFPFLLVLFVLLFSPQTQPFCKTIRGPSTLLKEADRYRKSLERSQKKKKLRHNWMKCLERYQKIYDRYPKSDQAAWALYHSAGLFERLSGFSGKLADLDEAIRLYRQLADEYETHRLADDAQYRLGEIFYKRKKDLTRAYVEFLKVGIKFPSGDMRPKAKKKLDQLALALNKRHAEEKKDGQDTGAGKALVKDIRHWSTPNYTRVVVDLDHPVKYSHHLLKSDPELKKPRRLYLDLAHAKVSSEIDSRIPIKDGLLQRARAGQYTEDSVRVVLDIESIDGYKVFHLFDPFRIVVDVRASEKVAAEPQLQPSLSKRDVRKGIRKAKGPDGKVSLARQLGLTVGRIVIDPGHGGKDPGCYIGRRVREKDIVLGMARRLAKRIKKRLGCDVVLTRNEDVFLPLERRTAVANLKKADLFISLHINAHRDRKICGVETYFLNMATDERAVMVAARENATSEKNISDLQAILNDLMLNTKIHESSRLAYDVQKGILSKLKIRYNHVRNLGVKQAPFYVLIGADMPAILIETGFLTNPTDRKRLLSSKYQEALAEGITAGITAYVRGIEEVYRGGG